MIFMMVIKWKQLFRVATEAALLAQGNADSELPGKLAKGQPRKQVCFLLKWEQLAILMPLALGRASNRSSEAVAAPHLVGSTPCQGVAPRDEVGLETALFCR